MPLLAAALRSPEPGHAALRARAILDAGFSRIVLFSPLWAADAEDLRRDLAAETIYGLEVFLPLPRALRPGQPSPFRLGSYRADDRSDAVKWGRESLLFAARMEIATVIIPPVRLDASLREAQLQAARTGNSGALLASIEASRRAAVRAPLDAFRSVLSRLLDEADRVGVRIALIHGGWADEMPNIREGVACLREFRGGPLRLWGDAAALHAIAALDRGAREELEGVRASMDAAIIRDEDEEGSPCVPGRGRVTWEAHRSLLEAAEVWVADPPGDPSPEELTATVEFLENLAAGPERPQPGPISFL